MVKYLFFFCITGLLSLSVCAQQVKITGKVVDREFKPIEYASVQLLDGDSIFINGTVTDLKGNLEIEANVSGSCLIRISNVGYDTYSTSIDCAHNDISIGTIILKEAAIILDSITVTARRIIHHIDRQIVFPNTLEKNSSNTAFDLIGNMGLSRLKVDRISKNITLIDGGTVQIRINGVPASVKEVYAIPSKEIIRVEYYDNPGAQVKETAILDIIVRQRQNGGYISADLSNAVNIGSGDNDVFLNINHKYSTFGISYFIENRNFKRSWDESTTTFNYPDGQEIVREEKGIPSRSNYCSGYAEASYNYTLPDKRVFNVNLVNTLLRGQTKSKNLTTYSNRLNDSFLISKKIKGPVTNPSFELYYKENLPKDQEITFELIGEYKRSKYDRDYVETNINAATEKQIIVSDIKGKQSLFYAEGNYKKKFKNILFLSGLNYNWSHAQNDYSGTIIEQSTLRNQELYVYAQLQGKHGNLSYMGNVGASYFDFDDKSNTYRYWQFRPGVSLSYNPLDDINIQYQMNFQTFAPSLSEMSDIVQIIDPYQIKKGNPNLKYYSLYANTLNISYQNNRFNAHLMFYNRYIKNPIWEDIYYDESEFKFVSVSDNQKSSIRTGIIAKMNWQIVQDILSLSLYGEICWMKVNGDLFHHKIAPFLGGGQLNFSMKGWQARFEMYNRIKKLQGTSIVYGDWPTDVLDVGYK